MNTEQSRSRRAPMLGVLLAAGGLLVLGGCNIVPEAQTDPTRFFVLSVPGVETIAAAKPGVVHLRPVELASYIKSKPMIVRRSNNEIEFREYARWGEPLEFGVARVLREELLARGAASDVLATGLRAVEVDYDYELTVHVLACEGGADGEVYFRATWSLSTTGAGAAVVSHGDFRATGLKWDGKSEASLASELSQAVAALSGEIATALAKPKN
jgi:hypothetical protein